ncbi:MAG: hypothetical protein L0Z50_19950 [Verrucomicrobiales bacterium]|nr:hypothetical protein [Verrucomicrobiales bacterium]
MAGAPAEDASPEFHGRVKELQHQLRQEKESPTLKVVFDTGAELSGAS